MALSPELCKEMYRDMWRIRLFEEEANRQTSLGSVVGALHMYCGEEAVAVGVCSNLRMTTMYSVHTAAMVTV